MTSPTAAAFHDTARQRSVTTPGTVITALLVRAVHAVGHVHTPDGSGSVLGDCG
ncbi:hypothetical protein OG429_20510 [Streptomyces sp. NBC_00190]|uniref:hypothetical protein n=1 Tax=unclassified Streptomyces TaxID=2593676 RepID=UPI002E2B08F9|nr:hypothetical protein [Streptomyces sp. NBC_00190]WSZ41451.1 hypothetical protein OG239_23290 [Streptomyces sp. NBC_00868]